MSRLKAQRSVCWVPTWNPATEGIGLEHLQLSNGSADSVILAFDADRGPFRLSYRLDWDESSIVRSAELELITTTQRRSLVLRSDGKGAWRDGNDQAIEDLNDCIDIDIWPTPFTNSFPIWREPLAIGERKEFRMAWVFGPELTVRPLAQAYTRLADRLYLYESLGGSAFSAELTLDEDGVVIDYEGLFKRVRDR